MSLVVFGSEKRVFDLYYGFHASAGKILMYGFCGDRVGKSMGEQFLDLGSIVSFLGSN
jgi:hypothetical protein